MKSYTTISVRPKQKEKLKVLRKNDGTYGDALKGLFDKAELDENTKKQLQEIEEEYSGEN